MFEKCLNLSAFEDIGLNITQPDADYQAAGFNFDAVPVDIDVSIKPEAVSVQIEYLLTIRKGDSEAVLKDFNIEVPLRLGEFYNSSIHMIERIIYLQHYNISTDCSTYNKNGLTNVYFKNNEIVQFVDFETYGKYMKSYRFQFAIIDANVCGKCTG